MRGRFEGMIINMYSDRQATEDMRGFRYVSVVEVELGTGVPVKAAIGTETNKALVNELSLKKDISPDHEKWSRKYIARTDNKRRFNTYFREERLNALMDLFAMKGASALFFCDELDAVLRVETSDPMRDPEKMERIMKRLVREIKVLSPTAAESKKMPKQDDDDDDVRGQSDVIEILDSEIDEDDIDLELELEEDEDTANAAAVASAAVAASAATPASAKKSATKKKSSAKGDKGNVADDDEFANVPLKGKNDKPKAASKNKKKKSTTKKAAPTKSAPKKITTKKSSE